MTWPNTPLTTYAANNLPAVKAADLNSLQTAMNALYNGPGLAGNSIGGVPGTRFVEDWSWHASIAAAGAFEGVIGRWTLSGTAGLSASTIALSSVAGTYWGRAASLNAATGAADTAHLADMTSGYGVLLAGRVIMLDYSAAITTVGANNTTIRGGINNAALGIFSAASGFIAFRRASGDTNWQCETANGGATTVTNSGIAAVANTISRFTILASTTQVEFFINDALVATHTTNIPTIITNGRAWSVVRTGAAPTGNLRIGPNVFGIY